MSAESRPGPASLAQLQASFGAVLRSPPGRPARETPAFAAMAAKVLAVDDDDANARLDVYRQQYWARLHNVMCEELPLTRWLLGERSFQALCLRYLRRHPPSHFDLHAIVAQMPAFLSNAKAGKLLPAFEQPDGLSPEDVVDAVRLDVTYAEVFLAPAPSIAAHWPTQPDGLKCRTLPLAPHARVIWTRPSLLQLRGALLAAKDSTLPRTTLPARAEEPSAFLLLGGKRGVRTLPLPSMHARLLTLLESTVLEATIAELKRAHPGASGRALQSRVQRWLANDIRLGIFRDQPRPTPLRRPP